MNRSFSVSLKATALATTLVWFLNISDGDAAIQMVPYVILSTIPIWIVCFTSIILTIVPFNEYKKGEITNKEIFQKYFPYYSICIFIGCATACIYFSFDIFAISFFSTVFFTATTSWFWFFKNDKKSIKLEIKLLQNAKI